MKPTLLSLLLFLLVSCNKSDQSEIDLSIANSYFYDYHLYISIKDGQGNDLLDPSNPKAFLQNHISLFYIDKNGKKEQNYNFENCYIYHIDDGINHNLNYLRLNCGYINLIQWNQLQTDTIQPDFIQKPYGWTFNAVKVNGKRITLIPMQPIDAPGFTIIK